MLDKDIITFVDEQQDREIIEVCKKELLNCSTPEERSQFISGVYCFLNYRRFEKQRIIHILKEAGAVDEELDITYAPEQVAVFRLAFPDTFAVLRDLTAYKEIEFTDPELRILADLQGWYLNDKIYFVFADGNRIAEVRSQALKEYLRLKYGLVLDSDFRAKLENEAMRKGEITTFFKHRLGITELSKYKLVLNAGQRVFIYDKLTHEFFEVNKPIYEQHYIERSNKLRLNFELLETLMKTPIDEFIKILRERVLFFYNFVKQWNFESEKTALLYTAFVVLLPSHTLWSWRPFLHVLGAPGTGKTLLFELTLHNLYDGLTLRADNVTPYALPQQLQDSGRIPTFDNFDIQNHKHAEMFNMLEASSRNGAVILRGTTGQEAKSLKLQHLPVFNSTTTIGFNTATVQRTVRLRLVSKPANVIHELSTQQYIDLATYFIVANLRLFELIEDEIRREEITDRLKENIQYPYCLLKLLKLAKSISEFESVIETEITNDSEELLTTILNANVRYENKPYSIDNLIVSIFENKSELSTEEEFFAEILDSVGIYVDKKQELVGFNYSKLETELLRRTRFRNISIHAFNELLRALGGKASQRMYYKAQQKRVTTVPYSVIRRILGLDS